MMSGASVETKITTVAVVGVGVIGRSWAQVFARAGCATRLYDRDPAQVVAALAWLASDLALDVAAGVLTQADATARQARIVACGTLAEALLGAQYVQESGPEQLPLKQAIYAQLDELAAPDTILASSTSALDMSRIAAGLHGAGRCVVAHPVNPPHVVPVVEIVPGELTEPAVVEATCSFQASIGQTPVRMRRHVDGFLLNRLQAALVREALSLLERGVADAAAIDAVVRDGLGLRWAFMGPFGVANTNADGGAREYFTRYGPAYVAMMDDLGPTPSFAPELIEQIGAQTDALAGVDFAAQRRWRDQMVRELRALKAAHPGPTPHANG
jgi:L-gulonate 3-dehydrogenase